MEAQGKEVPLDLFLYSCLEQERLLKAKKGTAAPVVRWPALGSEESPSPTPDVSSGTMRETVERMIAWYKHERPELADDATLDHRHLGPVVQSVVALNLDLDRLHRARTGNGLPEFGTAVGDDNVWHEITRAVEAHFSKYKSYILRYLQWAHAVEKVETFEPGSRPPVGKYAPPPLRKDGDRDRGRGRGGDRGGPRGDRGPRAFGDRPPRDDMPPRASQSDRPPREDRGERPPREDRGERPPREARGPRPPRDDRGPRGDRGGDRGPRRGQDEQTLKMTEAALAEADQAIASMRADASIEEVTLKPTNSFYRRIQHQQIVDAGFHSFSVGEGADRAVKVARKED